MATAAPKIGSNIGAELPTAHYSAGLIDAFPKPGRLRTVESGIADRYTEKIPPTNQTTNQEITDRYLFYNYSGDTGVLLDLSSIGLELVLTLTKDNAGTKLANEDTVIPVNGLLNTMFRNIQVYIGNKLVES